jgi:hypothetical protein
MHGDLGKWLFVVCILHEAVDFTISQIQIGRVSCCHLSYIFRFKFQIIT